MLWKAMLFSLQKISPYPKSAAFIRPSLDLLTNQECRIQRRCGVMTFKTRTRRFVHVLIGKGGEIDVHP